MNSRFLLALYETNAHLERGGTSASSFSTLEFGEAYRTGPPQLPEFLISFGGPICFIPDDDAEMFDSKMVPQFSEFEAGVGLHAGVAGETPAEGSIGEVGRPEWV